MSGLFIHVYKPARTNREQEKKKEEMFSEKSTIGIKMWQQRLETGNPYHAVSKAALFTAALKSKEMYVGTGF